MFDEDTLKKVGVKKEWLAPKLGLSRPTLDKRLEDQQWKFPDKIILKELFPQENLFPETNLY